MITLFKMHVYKRCYGWDSYPLWLGQTFVGTPGINIITPKPFMQCNHNNQGQTIF